MLGSGYYDAIAQGQPVGVVGAYQNAIDAIVPGASEMAVQATGPGQDFLSSLFQMAGQMAVTEAQRRLIEAQAQRMQTNQPPIPVSQYPRYGVSSVPTWAWVAGAGVLAFMFLGKRGR